MEKEFIPYTEALALKELGFNEECLALWQSIRKGEPYININCPQNIKALLSGRINNSDVEYIVSAPLWQQAFRFFREKYNLHYIVYKNINIDGYDFCEITIDGIINKNTFKTYEEAELECLKKLIEIAKEQNVK